MDWEEFETERGLVLRDVSAKIRKDIPRQNRFEHVEAISRPYPANYALDKNTDEFCHCVELYNEVYCEHDHSDNAIEVIKLRMMLLTYLYKRVSSVNQGTCNATESLY